MSNSKNPWIAFIPVIIGVFMAVLDASILMVALPKITQEFQATAADIQWILDSYLLTLVILLIVFGRLGDIFNRKIIYIVGISLFTLGSYLCAQSWNVLVFILFRILQAIGAAMIMGNSMALITELFPPGKRGTAMGVQSILIAASFALGPVLGGWITEHLSWHWVFYINVPIGILGSIMGIFVLPSEEMHLKEELDILGVIMLAISLGFLTLGIIKGQDWGWYSLKTILCFIIFLCWGFALIFRELSSKNPVLDLKLFKIENFSAPLIGLFFLSMGLAIAMFLVQYYLQGILLLGPEQAGLWMAPLSLINIFVAPIAGRLSDKIDPKITMVIGPLIYLYGVYAFMHVGINSTFWDLLPGFLAIGAGLGLVMPAAMNVMMSSVPKEKSGMASGTIQTFNSLARSIGISFGGAVFTSKMNEYIPGYGSHIPTSFEIKYYGILYLNNIKKPLLEITDAFIKSFHSVFLVATPFIILSLFIFVFLVKGGKITSSESMIVE